MDLIIDNVNYNNAAYHGFFAEINKVYPATACKLWMLPGHGWCNSKHYQRKKIKNILTNILGNNAATGDLKVITENG
jgi:hypothetical protein